MQVFYFYIILYKIQLYIFYILPKIGTRLKIYKNMLNFLQKLPIQHIRKEIFAAWRKTL